MKRQDIPVLAFAVLLGCIAGLLIICVVYGRRILLYGSLGAAWRKQRAPPLPSGQLDLGGGRQLSLVLIPAGKFVTWPERTAQTKHLHEVTISRDFYLSKYLITQDEWLAVMGSNPSRFKGAKNPVENISWQDAQDFSKRVSQSSGRIVRLPREAEWEYACRAGTRTQFFFGDDPADIDEYAWWSDKKTHPIGEKEPNPWGLYDMVGNVWQWCQDWYSGDYFASSQATDPVGPASGAYHVIRGGSFDYDWFFCRSAMRAEGRPDLSGGLVGLRVLVEVQAEGEK